MSSGYSAPALPSVPPAGQPPPPDYRSMYYVAGVNEQGEELRKFNDAAIQEQIDRAVAGMRPEDHFTVVAYATEQNGERKVTGAALYRLDGPWGVDFSFVGIFTHDFSTGDNRKEVGIRLRG